jgi:hypothetical protein
MGNLVNCVVVIDDAAELADGEGCANKPMIGMRESTERADPR